MPHKKRISPFTLGLVTTLVCSLPLTAAILPENRVDFLFHFYEGGGVTIKGPAIQARKQISNDVSLSAKYYIDSVSSASIDVMSYASPYTEERKEQDYSVDFLRGSSSASLSYAVSEESDYLAKSYHFTIAQDMFGELTTISIGYSKGDDVVKHNNYSLGEKVSTNVIGDIDRNQFRIGISQILSKNFIVNLNHESITDEAFPAGDLTPLNNPYRLAFFHKFDIALGIDLCPDNIPCATGERYPNTRSSNATAISALYYLPYRASIKAQARFFSDTWGIQGEMFDIGYTQPIKRDFIVDLHYRAYSQTKSSFYADQFTTEQTFMARDKEMSTFTSTTIGARVSYNFSKKGWLAIDKGSLNMSYDMIQFNYADFYDRTMEGGGMNWSNDAPLYNFSADVFQFYVSIWY